jgi:hypothetical protein
MYNQEAVGYELAVFGGGATSEQLDQQSLALSRNIFHTKSQFWQCQN